MTRRAILCAIVLVVTVSLKVAGADAGPADGAVSVKVTGPAMNAILDEGSTMTIIAEADAAPGRIAKVEFYNSDKLLGVATAAPYRLLYHGPLSPGNYCLRAKAFDERGQSAVSPAVTVTARRRIQWTAKSYDYEETSEGALKQARLMIPDGLRVVRGILVYTNASGGDTRNDWKQNWCREFLYMHGFAFFGAKAFNSHDDTLTVFHNALRKFAADSGHTELEAAPFAITGFSAGAGFAMTLLNDAPDRVIACAPVSARNLRLDGNKGLFSTPLCLISGELEGLLNEWILPLMEASRPQGALFSWMTVQGFPHRYSGQQVLMIPFLDQAVRLRYPADRDPSKGPVKLLPVDAGKGWVADHTTWKGGLTSIVPVSDFRGPVGKSSWLLNKDVAFIYRAYATYDNPLKITSLPAFAGAPAVFDPGANLTLTVDDAAFGDWRSLEFFAGAEKLGELHARPARLTVSDLKTGVYAFSVLATDVKGVTRTSSPVLIIVRKLPPEASAQTQPAPGTQPAVGAPPALRPGQSFTLQFPDLPPTFAELVDPKGIKPQMTVFLPKNYDPARKHPLLIFLNGGTGGRGGNPSVARALAEDTDFICVSLPLFKEQEAVKDIVIRDADCKLAWPLYKTMLAGLEQTVPNIDPDHRVLGGFSNGAHTTRGLIDQSDGEVARRFSAFLLVEGGGGLQRYDLLKGKSLLILYGDQRRHDTDGAFFWADRTQKTALDAGAKADLHGMTNVGHDFPASEYPVVRKWLLAATDQPATRLDAAAAASETTAKPKPGTEYVTVQVGPQTRTCMVHLPPAYDGKRLLPLVIALHGSGGTDSGMANETLFNPLADREGFIVAYPNGIVGGNRGWNALFGKPIPGGQGAQVDDVDDVGFIRSLIDQLHNFCQTDPSRVFVCGHSSGAYMAYRVAIDLSDRVAAVGVVNGSIGIRLLDGKPSISEIPSPVTPVSIIHIRGGKDNLVKSEGVQTERVLAKSVDECIQHFVKADGCATPGKESIDAEHGLVRTLYSGGKAGTEVELVIVQNAGHAWPNPQVGLSTCQELWDFFSRHPKHEK